MPQTGSCLCGAVTFTVDASLTEAAACHCSMCRKWSGGILMAVEVPADGLDITGADSLKVYPSSDWGERAFCAECGSSLWFRLVAPGPMHGTHYVSMGALDDTSGIHLTVEMFTDQRPEGYALAGDHAGTTAAEFHAMVEAEIAKDS